MTLKISLKKTLKKRIDVSILQISPAGGLFWRKW
jgi:hypothetical protein